MRCIAAKPYRMARVIGIDPEYKLIDESTPAGEIRAYVKRSPGASDPAYQPTVKNCGRVRRRVRCRSDAGEAEATLPARSTYGFHLRGGRRRARLWGSTAILVGFFVILWRGLRLF